MKYQRILLIQPPWYRLFGSGVTLKLPLGLCYISALLNKHGFKASVYDAEFDSKVTANLSTSGMTRNIDDYLEKNRNLNHQVWKDIESKIKSYDPDVVGISVKTPALRSAMNIAQICRNINPDIKIVMGGFHATCLPQETINSKNVDFVVIGEGEYAFLGLLKSLNSGEDLKKCKGLVYKDEAGRVLINPPGELIPDLDELPDPDRDNVLDAEKYPKESYGEIFTGRGCPYRCIFCASMRVWGRKTRHRSAKRVIDEIEYVHKKYGTKYFCVEDDTFMMDRNRMNEFCDLLMEKKLPIRWECETRVNLVTQDSLEKIKRAGCVLLNVGVESGNDETLKKIKKDITISQIQSAFKLIHSLKIPVSAYIMIGFPWETKEDMVQTVSFAESLLPQRLVMSVVTPYPGIELFDICNNEFNMRLNNNCSWEEFFHQSNRVVLPNMKPEEFNDLVVMLEKRVMNYTIKMRSRSLDFWKARIGTYLMRPRKIIDDIYSVVKQR